MNANYCVPTGVILKQYIDEINMSQKELCAKLGMSEKHISNLLNGKVSLTEDMAIKLENIFSNIPASYWINLESKYKEFVAREEQDRSLEAQDLIEISKKFKFSEVFKGMNWSLLKQAREMLKILGISSYDNFEFAFSNLNVEFFEDGGEKESIAVWIKLCEEQIELQNDNLENISYSKKTFEDNLSKFKDIANNSDVNQSIINCRKLCNKLGVYLVIHDAITNSKVRGALITYKNNPAILLSGRFKSHDNIWFAFIHEVGHLLKHYKNKEQYVTYGEDDKDFDKEDEAHEFARDFFINKTDYIHFVEKKDFSLISMREFANQQNIQLGILVARLQHDKNLPITKYNYIKTRK